MTIGEKIKRLRKENGWTQQDLGDRVGVQKAAINKYETGVVVNLKLQAIKDLARAFDVNPVWLMNDDEEWPPMPSTKSLIARAAQQDRDAAEESALIEAWRTAEEWQKEAVRKLLNI